MNNNSIDMIKLEILEAIMHHRTQIASQKLSKYQRAKENAEIQGLSKSLQIIEKVLTSQNEEKKD